MTEEKIEEIVNQRLKKFLDYYYEPMRGTLLKQVERNKKLEQRLDAIEKQNKKKFKKPDSVNFFSTCELHLSAYKKVNQYLIKNNLEPIEMDEFIQFLQSSEEYMSLWADWRLNKEKDKKPKIFVTKMVPYGLNAVRFGTQEDWENLKDSPIPKEGELFFDNAPHVQLKANPSEQGYTYTLLNLRTGEKVIKNHNELVGLSMLVNGEKDLGKVAEL